MSSEFSWERRWGFEIPDLGDFYIMELVSGDGLPPWRAIFMDRREDQGFKADFPSKADAMKFLLHVALKAVDGLDQ